MIDNCDGGNWEDWQGTKWGALNDQFLCKSSSQAYLRHLMGWNFSEVVYLVFFLSLKFRTFVLFVILVRRPESIVGNFWEPVDNFGNNFMDNFMLKLFDNFMVKFVNNAVDIF